MLNTNKSYVDTDHNSKKTQISENINHIKEQHSTRIHTVKPLDELKESTKIERKQARIIIHTQ